MKLSIKMGLFALCLTSVISCDTGWTDNKKEAVRETLETNFKKGLAQTGASIPEEDIDGWVDCVSDKIFAEFESFEEFEKNQDDPRVEKFMEVCEEAFLSKHY